MNMKSAIAFVVLMMLASGALAQEITVGTVVPDGKSFAIQWDERTLSRQPFRTAIQEVATAKVRAMFPNGIPRDASRITIALETSLGKAPDVRIRVGC